MYIHMYIHMYIYIYIYIYTRTYIQRLSLLQRMSDFGAPGALGAFSFFRFLGSVFCRGCRILAPRARWSFFVFSFFRLSLLQRMSDFGAPGAAGGGLQTGLAALGAAASLSSSSSLLLLLLLLSLL